MDATNHETGLAERLTARRKKAGLTQAQLAEKINYSDKVISKWERGESLPDIAALLALSKFYGVTLDDLAGESGAETDAPPPESAPVHSAPPTGFTPPPAGYAPPPTGFAPPPSGYAPPSGFPPPPAGYTPPPGFIPPPNPYHTPAYQGTTPSWYKKEDAAMWANRAFILAIVSLFLVELGMLLGAIAVAIGARSYKILKRVGAPADKAKKAIIIGGAAVAVGAVVLVLLIVFVF